jgi:hypothetical protein
MKIQNQEKIEGSVMRSKFLTGVAVSTGFFFRRIAGPALVGALTAALCAATAWAQNTQVTIEGTITSVGSVPGITVGDKYSMVVYYNPTQAPSSTIGAGEAYYSAYTLNAVVDDKNGNQAFSISTNELLFVSSVAGSNDFFSTPCCDATGAGFVLEDNVGTAFTTDALPTALTLSDFNYSYVAFGSNAIGKITSIKVVNTSGVMPAFITAGTPDPNGKVPVIDGVPGAGVANLGVAAPQTILVHGNSYVYTVALQDVNFTGTCQASFTLTQVQYNKTVTLDSAKDDTFSCGPGTWWVWVFGGKTIPNFPGPATLTGTVTYGSEKASTTTTVVLQ